MKNKNIKIMKNKNIKIMKKIKLLSEINAFN
jgi:hypothetical protein